jgi:hypothetical protein
MFDMFLTKSYKGCFIHQKRDVALRCVIVTWSSGDNSVFNRPAKSRRSAQIQITNWLKQKHFGTA